MSANVRNLPENSEPRLTTKQETLISLLIAGIKINAAAKQLRCNERTCRRWLALPHVQTAYKAAQQQVFEDALSELQLGASEAIKTLRRHMTSDDTRSYVQVQAASKWLDLSLELHKMAQLEQLAAELERRMKEGF